MASSSASWNCQWTRMVTCLPVLCGIGAPCQCWGDRVGVGYNHFWCLDICGVLIFVGVLISQYFWELMSEVVSSVECPLPCLRVCWCSLVGVSGKWIIGEDLLPREMTVTHEPNGTEYFPAYCAGDLFHPWTHIWYLIWNRMYTFPHTVLVILSSLSHPWCIFNLI